MKQAVALSIDEELKQRIAHYRQSHPRSRTIDVARGLGLSEVELIFASCDDRSVVALRPDWSLLWKRFPELGRVMALTRNSFVVSECRGVYGEAHIDQGMGIVHSEGIDLRLFTRGWKAIFAVEVASARGPLQSLQIFDRCGRSVHKIYLEAESSREAYELLIEEFRSSLSEQIYVPEKESALILKAVSGEQREGLLEDWKNLDDTHSFHGMLRRHGVDRLQAIELATGSFSREVQRESVSQLLEEVQARKWPLMVFVGNPGMIQIYSGLVANLLPTGSWFNVIDPDFNLHIDREGIERVFVVEKPSKHGSVWSLEIFSADRTLILSLFAVRTDDSPPDEVWKLMLGALGK